MSKTLPSDLLKTPADFIYIYAGEWLYKMMPIAKAKIVAKKRANQLKYVHGVCVDYQDESYYESFVNLTLKEAISEEYGMSPTTILYKLACGDTVAGKNWQEGVYGIGVTNHTQFSNTTDYTVDATTGKILHNGTEMANQTATYGMKNGNTYITGYSATAEDGTIYTSKIDKKKAGSTYSSYTFGTSSGAYYYNGISFLGNSVDDIWTSIQTFIPQFTKYFQYFLSLATELSTTFKNLFSTSSSTATKEMIVAENTIPSQEEFVESSSSDFSKIGIVGVALIGGYFLLKK